MKFGEYRKAKMLSAEKRQREKAVATRHVLSTQEERFLYSLRIKTMEYRTLMCTLKDKLPRSAIDEIIVEYAMRLRKARKNFETNNFQYEWEDDHIE